MIIQVLQRPEDALIHESSCLMFRDLLLHGALLNSDGQLVTGSEKDAGGSSGSKCWVVVYSERKDPVNKRTLNCPVLTSSVYRFTLPLARKELNSLNESIYFSCEYIT